MNLIYDDKPNQKDQKYLVTEQDDLLEGFKDIVEGYMGK